MFARHRDKLDQIGIMSKGQSDKGTWKLQFAQYQLFWLCFFATSSEKEAI